MNVNKTMKRIIIEKQKLFWAFSAVDEVVHLSETDVLLKKEFMCSCVDLLCLNIWPPLLLQGQPLTALSLDLTFDPAWAASVLRRTCVSTTQMKLWQISLPVWADPTLLCMWDWKPQTLKGELHLFSTSAWESRCFQVLGSSTACFKSRIKSLVSPEGCRKKRGSLWFCCTDFDPFLKKGSCWMML